MTSCAFPFNVVYQFLCTLDKKLFIEEDPAVGLSMKNL